MILVIISCVIAALSLAAVIFIIFRHWKEMRLLDPMSIKEEQHRQKREELIRARFERLHAESIQPFQRFGRHIQRHASRAHRNISERLHAFESMYQNVKNPFSSMTLSSRERTKTLINEGRAFMRDQKWADAERRYLEILSMDARNQEAYKGLGHIYLKQKLYPQAKETFEFLLKMKKADDVVCAALAEIADAEGDIARCEAMRLKSVEFSPRQAHRHAELADFYQSRGEHAKAWPSAKRASDLEPNSAKYLELSLELALHVRDAIESRRRYNRLRLLADDRARATVWREKVEALEAESAAANIAAKKQK